MSNEGAELDLSIIKIAKDKLIRETVIEKIEDFLKNNSVRLPNLSQFESIIIEKNINSVWNLITNWKKLSEVAPLIADDVELKGDPKNIDSVIKLFFIDKKMMCLLKVKEIDATGCNWTYHLECFDGFPKVPLQEIQFNLIKIDEDSCFLSFNHIFKEAINPKLIMSIEPDKRKILAKIKKYFNKDATAADNAGIEL